MRGAARLGLRHFAAALAGALALSCAPAPRGAAHLPPTHAPDPPSASPAASPSPPPSPSPSPAPQALTLTGPGLAASLTGAAAVGPCGGLPGGFVANLEFEVKGSPLAVTIVISPYHGPGAYPAPPAQVSAHTVGLSESAALYAGVSGQVTVLPGGRSGTVHEVLLRSPDRYLLKGAWRCG
ncbi:MAG: hypothetical protein ACREPI_09810 [Candidatus Dormibacterales bacterium]